MSVIQSLIGRQLGGTDPFWSNVVSLLWFNGNLTDQRGKTWGAGGSAAVSTSQVKFGSHSISIPDIGSTVSSANNADWDFPEQFCIDFWLYISTFGSSGTLFIHTRDFNPANALNIRITAPGNIVIDQDGVGNVLNSFGTLATGTWHHVAISRDGTNTLRIFRNGVGVSGTVTSANFSPGSGTLIVGPASGGAAMLIDDLRITKGAARYTSAFTPPTFEAPNA